MSVIKICGFTQQEDALVAAKCGADLLGFVFHRPSKRYVSTEKAAAIVKTVNDLGSQARWIGVFVDEPIETILETADSVGLDGVQFHGSMHADVASSLRGHELLVIAGHRIAGHGDITQLDTFDADAHLLDAYVPGLPGGTGTTFDWSLAAQAATRHRILLAGGLTPGNVACAIHIVRPWGVDVSSGIEISPGIKDVDKIRQFIAQARTALDAQGGKND